MATGICPRPTAAAWRPTWASAPRADRSRPFCRRSLDLAQSVWHEAAEAGPYRRANPRRMRPGGLPSARAAGRNRLAVAVVILAALLLAVLGPWLARRSQQVGRASPEGATARQPDAPQPNPTTQVPAPHDNPPLDAILASETRTAPRLAASIEILASQPGLEEFKNDAQRYLVTTYPGTAAAQRRGGRAAEEAVTKVLAPLRKWSHITSRTSTNPEHSVWAAQNRWNPHPLLDRTCGAILFRTEVREVIRAEGPAVHPAKGEALVYRSHRVFYSAVSCGVRPNGPRVRLN